MLDGADFVILRDLSSGLYFGEPRGIETLPDGARDIMREGGTLAGTREMGAAVVTALESAA